jgi:hypothetical protein
VTRCPGFLDPLLSSRLDGVELNVHVRRGLCDNLVRLVDETSRVDELNSIKGAAAGVTLVTSSVLISYQPQ